MSKKRIVLAVGGLIVVIVGLPFYMSATATPLHPQPQSAPSVTQSDPSPQWSDVVDRARHIMRAGLAEQNLPGLSVAVGVGGDIVWAEGFGWADIETRMPVTLRQLMAHVGGVGTDGGGEGPLFRQRCERPVEAVQHFADGALLFEPGTQYRHSKYGWILVSAAVEGAGDQPFLTFMREQIFQPLGMDDTGAESATEENPEHVGEPAEDAPFLTLIRDVILEPLGIGGTKAKSATGEIPDRAKRTQNTG